MADVTGHYKDLLAGVYTWLYGGATIIAEK